MSDVNDGGPAFPVESEWAPNADYVAGCPGMTLRDYFAGQALGGLASAEATIQAIVRDSYRIADAMLKERSKPQ